ncbi:protein FAR-RED IMPAIRED RESPONSE 1-like [Chenopodium quinoa]|uniref:protein FAR-RED IMPAIRED RESPONSE 1-like n=1 Tax=Chenopodium quinoa TaxID=63459 RepID=UPI000B786DA4|nr:protein FAR-RED IMPAIRED RESPONSE 1-like [Chenopodium quinoa]
MASTVRKRLLNYFEIGVPVPQICGYLGTENENLPNVKDMQHEVYKERRLKMEGGDAKAIGVNHHGQSPLLRCALVSREDCDTFRCIFRQWLSCMGNKAPLAILTDQAPAMRKPLAEVMPNTRHRWCIWHILKKFPKKLGKCALYNDFKNPLKNVIYDNFTIDEFQRR